MKERRKENVTKYKETRSILFQARDEVSERV